MLCCNIIAHFWDHKYPVPELRDLSHMQEKNLEKRPKSLLNLVINIIGWVQLSFDEKMMQKVKKSFFLHILRYNHLSTA